MAKRKAKAKKTTSKKRAKASASSRPKKPAGKAGPETEVERRWNEYWRCRKQLEEAVAAVAAAQQGLATALELERARRTVFEDTKRSLEQLLEVAPPAPASAAKSHLDLVANEDD